MNIVLIVVLVIAVLIILYFVGTYNTLVKLRNRVNDQWGQIEVQLKRRFDLIPNIVETVKGYAKHESESLKGIIEARNKFNVASTRSDEMKASNQLTGAIRGIFALSESYPELKANQNFLDLQETLKDTEDKISSARQFYNDTVVSLNDKVMMFPSNIVAKMFKFEKVAYFEAESEAKEAPKVSF